MAETYDAYEGLRQHIASVINESMNETGELDSLEDELLAYADSIMKALQINARCDGSDVVTLLGHFYRDGK